MSRGIGESELIDLYRNRRDLQEQVDLVKDILTGFYGLVGMDDTPEKVLARIARAVKLPLEDLTWEEYV